MKRDKKSAPSKDTRTYFDCAFEDYKGIKRFTVSHPAHIDSLRVAAPDEQSAIVAAADRLGERWTRYSFYAYCTVLPA